MSINIIKYWLTSLRDIELIGSSSEVFKKESQYIECSQQIIASGCLPELEKVKLLQLLKAESKTSNSGDEADGRIIICPLILVPNNKSGLENSLAPMWIPAKLEANGNLLPDCELLPWLARQLLSPQESEIGIGDVDELERFLLDRECPQENWEDYYEFCLELFSTVTGQELTSFNLPMYFSRSNAAIAPNKLIRNISQPIQRVYEQVIGYPRNLNSTLKNLASTTDRVRNRLLTPVEQQKISRLHLGQMQGKHPLSTSQREALYHFLSDRSEGEILAINGPPGTGKTTLLQSAIASLWVERALAKGEPPIIVASSTNNQAVTNIITSFTSEPSQELLSQRWLPQIDSYGLFLASSGKFKEENNWQKLSTGGQGFIAEMESEEGIREARFYFLDKCQEYYKRPISNVSNALKLLHASIEMIAGKMFEVIDSLSLQQMESFQGRLDCQHRYILFQLATHYWEGRWLEDCRELPEKKPPCLQATDWYRYAKLTPCFVSTFFMVPRFFSPYNGGYKIMWNFIDLLIVDEAGQVSPEVAGASFALAKQALVVGDTLQIEPVWSITTPVDAGNLLRNRINIEVDDFKELGLSAANGSVMAISQRASRYQKLPDRGGMFLSEHRRCVDEIIQYCNLLCYKGKLQPLRGSLPPDKMLALEEDFLLPAMGYLHVAGKAQKAGGSRCNQIEARTIAEWIVRYQKVLERHYELPLGEIVGVVTPFAQQAAEIKSAIAQIGIAGVTVGTVHSLQGAERSIVIFSSTYDRSQGSQYFFDRQPNMLNVAVSRAKDSFLVFGDTQIFDAKQLTPSGVLASILFSSERNRLPELSRRLNPIEEGKRHCELGILKFKEDPQQALVEFERAIELNPQNAYVYNWRGRLKCLYFKDYEGAEFDMMQAFKLDPQMLDSQLKEAEDERDSAKSEFDKDPQHALEGFDLAILLNPQDAEAYHYRGCLKSLHLNDTYGAFADFSKAIEIAPEEAINYCNRGVINYNSNKLEDALADLNKSIFLDSRCEKSYYIRGLTKCELGNDIFDGVKDTIVSARIAWEKDNTEILKLALNLLKSRGMDLDPSLIYKSDL